MSNATIGNPVTHNAAPAFCTVNAHCLENIVRLSDDMEVLASSDIVDDCGIKLWAKGKPVSRALQEKMLKRRLRQPLEVSLDVGDGVCLESIVSDCFGLMKETPALDLLGGSSGAKGALRSVCNVPLPGPLKLLLTSTREHKKQNYAISLASMITCSGLAYGIGLNDRDAGILILSALVHDVGEMYINPEYLDDDRPLQASEWKYVASHPCVGQAFLKEFAQFPAAVADCVVHHHERLDGSGYPFQVSGETMGPLCKLISVADSVSAIVMRGGPSMFDRVDVALRIVPEEFPRPAVSFITKTLAPLREECAPATAGSFAERVLPTLQQLRSARLLAEALIKAHFNKSLGDVGQFTYDALRNIDKSLRATGVYEFSQLAVLESDPVVMGEVCLVLKEVTWRLRNLARNVHLRTEKSGNSEDLAQISELIDTLGTAPTLTRLQ